MADLLPADPVGTLGRLMLCSSCQHDEHVLPCETEIVPGVTCVCRDVPVPGIHPFVPRGPRG